MVKRFAIACFLTALATVASAQPQGTVTFTALLPSGTLPNIGNGSVIPFNVTSSASGVTATIFVNYAGPIGSSATIGPFSLTGSPDFQLLNNVGTIALVPGQSSSFAVRYLPTTGSSTNANLSFNVLVNNGNAGSTTTETVFNLVGSAADLTFSVTSPQDGSTAPISPGGRIVFPSTTVSDSSQRVLSITNQGTAATAIGQPSLSGNDFVFNISPVSTTVLQPGQSINYELTYRFRI